MGVGREVYYSMFMQRQRPRSLHADHKIQRISYPESPSFLFLSYPVLQFRHYTLPSSHNFRAINLMEMHSLYETEASTGTHPCSVAAFVHEFIYTNQEARLDMLNTKESFVPGF